MSIVRASDHTGFCMLSEVAEFINGYAFAPEDWGADGPPIIRIQNLTDRKKPYNRTKLQVQEKYHVRPGELLVSWSASLGVFEWAGPEVGLVNQHIFRVKPKTDVVDQRYLRHALVAALESMERHLHGATMKHVNRGEFLSSKIFLPPISEQRRIAAILDHADALRAKRRAALAQLDEMVQAIFVEMFGDPGSNPIRFPISCIGDLLKSASYGTSSKAGSNGAFPILRMGNINYDGSWNLSSLKYIDLGKRDIERYTVVPGDILFNRTNSPDLVGKTAVFREPQQMAYAGYLVRLRTNDDANADYVSCFLNSQHGKSVLRGMCKSIIGMANINAKEVQSIRIPRPPRDLQDRFSEKLNQLYLARLNLVKSADYLERLFLSLQHRAFRGEL